MRTSPSTAIRSTSWASGGTLYNYDGTPVNLREGYASFIEAMKQAHPDKSLVMNAVSRYGARQIGETGKVDFFYNEMWADEADFTHLKAVLYENGVYGNNQLNTVFAAYMNYNKADQRESSIQRVSC